MDSPARDDGLLLAELEAKRQELYTAQRSKETLTANIRHLEFENGELKNALAQEMQKRKDLESQAQTKNDLMYRQQIADLRSCLEEAQAGEKAAKEESQKLEQSLKHLVETSAQMAVPSAQREEEEEMELLQQNISELEEAKNLLKAKLGEATVELKKKMEEISGLKGDMAEKEEEIECLEAQFSTQCNIRERLQEENQELRAELESQAGQVDTRKKGNSLFSEVDDRRRAAENKLVKLGSAVQDLEEKVTKEQKENKRLKQQVLLLRQTASMSKGYDEAAMKSLMWELEESKRTVIRLNEQLLKREPVDTHKQTQDFELPAHRGATDSEQERFINFLKGIISQERKKVQDAKEELARKRMELLRADLHLSETKNEVLALTHECQKLKVTNSHLSMTINEMQHKYEPELFAPSSKGKVKIVPDQVGATVVSRDGSKMKILQPLNPGQVVDKESDKEMSGTKSTTGGMNGDSKGNIQSILPSALFRGRSSKSVRMNAEVDTVSGDGAQSQTDLKADGKGEQLKRTGKGTGKFRSVTYCEADTTAPECKQQ